MRRLPRLRTYLIGVVALAMVPPVLLAAWLIFKLDRHYREGTRQNALLTARALSDAVDRAFNDSVASLETLGISSLLDRLDLLGFRDRLLAVGQTRGWTDAALLDASGRSLLRTWQTAGEALPAVADREVFEAVRRTGRPAVVSAVADRPAGLPAIAVGVPVSRFGVIHYVLVAGVPPAKLRRVLLTQAVPADWQVELSDHRQRIVASTLDPGPSVGESIPSRLASESARADEGWFPGIDRQGRPDYVVFHRSSRSGLLLTMGRPRSDVDGPANRALGIAAGAGLVLIGLGFVAALGLARRLGNSLLTVRHAADALGNDRAAAVSGAVAVREHRTVLDALERSAALLAAHGAERDRLDAEREAALARARNAQEDLATQYTVARESEERVTAVIASAMDAVVVIDEDERIRVFNPAAEQMFRCRSGDVLGSELERFIPAPAREVHHRHIREFGTTGVTSRTMGAQRALSALRADGEEFPMEATISQIRVAGRRFYTVILRDVSERVRADRERDQLLAREQAARADAETANRAKDEFLATLSHELRTPLNAIYGYARMLQAGQLAPDGAARALDAIVRNANVQVQLIDDLLDVSRVISGKMRLTVRPVDLKAVVDAALDTVRPAAESKGIRLRSVLDPGAGPITGDPDRLQQVVWNLLANAVKFTPKGGQVQVHLQRVNSHVELVISDTGEGIAPDLLPYIFERFRQGDSSSTRAHTGLGLGLALVKHLVELHGGTVAAQSPGVGLGTTFVVRLPLTIAQLPPDAVRRVHPTAALVEAPGPGARLDGLRVLVVDDDPDAVDLLSAILSGAEAIVRGCGTASDALVMLQAWRPDVLISDIEMPKEDGYALIRKVRALDEARGGKTPAIALTAYGRPQDRVLSLSAGYSMHVPKPVDPGELTTIIASLTGRLVSDDSALEGLTRPVARPMAPAAGRRRILVVEDDDDARETLRIQLALAGHEVHTAGDGRAGVALAATVAPDVALIDVGLPELDGYEVARQIRAGKGGQAIRLIALTGYGQPNDRRQALDAGFDAHVTKPILPSRLFELIAAARLSSE